MALRDHLMDLDSKIGVPGDADEAFSQNIRYWWVGLAVSIVELVLVLVALAFGWWVAAAAAIFAPLLAFASGYYYAHKLMALGQRSSWLDRRSAGSQ